MLFWFFLEREVLARAQLLFILLLGWYRLATRYVVHNASPHTKIDVGVSYQVTVW